MPVKIIRKGAGKKAKQRHVEKVMHELTHSGRTCPHKQRVAIAMKAARIRRRKKR